MKVFKTAWFAKEAKKAHISDDDLCRKAREVAQGKADNLGDGVYKKRLQKNLYRSIILAKNGENFFYTFLYAKKDQANISDDELCEFKKLAKTHGSMNEGQIQKLLDNQSYFLVCGD